MDDKVERSCRFRDHSRPDLPRRSGTNCTKVGMNPGLVIFDCDGVLVDSERLVNRIEAECLQELDIVATPTAVRALFKGKTVAEIVTILEERLGRPLPPAWLYTCGMATANGFVQELR